MLTIIFKSIATTLSCLLMILATVYASKDDKKSYQAAIIFDVVMTFSLVAIWI